MAAIGLALAAALAYALASVLQQRVARSVPDDDALRLRLLWRLVHRPLWLAGTAVDGIGFGLQAAALGLGSLIVVQPVLCTGLLFALPIGAAWAGRRLSPSDWAWAAVLSAGLVAFLVVGDPSAGKDLAPIGAWLVVGGITLAVVGAAVGVGRRAGGARRALALAIGTAVLYGLTGALTKSAVHRLGDGIVAFATSWEPYVGAAAGLLGMVLNQSAFQAGELEASLPALTAVEPVAAAFIGAALLDERVQAHGALEWTAFALSAAAMLTAVLALARAAARVEAAMPAAG